MRDIAVTFLFFAIVFYSLRKPFIGVSAWTWVALAYPAGWAWGFSNNFRINFTVSILTIVGYAIMKEKPSFKVDNVSVFILLFWVVSLISCLVTDSLLIQFYWAKFSDFTKILVLYLCVILIITKKIHVDALLWSILLAVSGYAGMEAVKFISSGGGHRVAGFAGHILGDRNDLVVAINMCLPIVIYLISQTKHKLIRLGLIGLLVFNLISIIGSYSRAGFLGLIVLGGYFFWKSKRKFLWAITTVIILSFSSQFVPKEWGERMNTVSTASSQDLSFIGRLWAWKISVKIANHNFFGNSFMATQDPLAWHTHRTSIDEFGFVSTPPIPKDQYAKAAHNIYFQVLGDFGYIGLLLFLSMLYGTYRRLKYIAKRSKEIGIEWSCNLSTMLQVSLVGYGITGANVSLAYFDLLFVIIGLSYVLKYRIISSAERKIELRVK